MLKTIVALCEYIGLQFFIQLLKKLFFIQCRNVRCRSPCVKHFKIV